MRERLDSLLGRLRAAGVLALGVLLGNAAFYGSALAPAEGEISLRRAAEARTDPRPGAPGGGAADLRRFYNHFPTIEAAGGELERIHRFARDSGLELAQGEYRLEQRTGGLRAYRMSLPLRGSYAQIRSFLDAVLKEVPVASLDALRLERKKASDTQLEAQLRITLYIRPAGEPS
jgi:hypothetical protein